MNLDLTAAVNAKRQQAQWFMSDAVTITDPGTMTTDSDGGTSISGESSSSVNGRLVRAGTQAVIAEFGAQITAEADYALYLPYGTTIREGWTVTIAGEVYTVIAVSKPSAWQVMVRAAIVKSTAVGG